MNGPITQFAALACHANAFLQGKDILEFLPANSTCKFCDWVKFVEISKTFFGRERLQEVAANPNAWFAHLRSKGAMGIRLSLAPHKNPGFPDRMSAAFVGGGGTWAVEVSHKNGKTRRWLSKWEVWDQKAPEHRIWRVTYGRVSEHARRPQPAIELEPIAARLSEALSEIHAFSEKHELGGFTEVFAHALETLNSGGAVRHGFHKDLAPDGFLPLPAACLLDACQSGWVFGGMGSWNDLAFDGADQKEYERVSENLFTSINRALQSAVNISSAPD